MRLDLKTMIMFIQHQLMQGRARHDIFSFHHPSIGPMSSKYSHLLDLAIFLTLSSTKQLKRLKYRGWMSSNVHLQAHNNINPYPFQRKKKTISIILIQNTHAISGPIKLFIPSRDIS